MFSNLDSVATGLVGLLSALVIWLYKVTFVNNTKIAQLEVLLKQKEKLDDERHKESLQAQTRLKDTIKDTERRILDMIRDRAE